MPCALPLQPISETRSLKPLEQTIFVIPSGAFPVHWSHPGPDPVRAGTVLPPIKCCAESIGRQAWANCATRLGGAIACAGLPQIVSERSREDRISPSSAAQLDSARTALTCNIVHNIIVPC